MLGSLFPRKKKQQQTPLEGCLTSELESRIELMINVTIHQNPV